MRENEEQCCGTCKWHQNEKKLAGLAPTLTASIMPIGRSTATLAKNGRADGEWNGLQTPMRSGKRIQPGGTVEG